ncbi:MAG TPA: lysophospholipid acyltransferase family protein [Longimicrobium sp.]|nr:lysophospholipid acyltransferase family protein [Longimicrobium sp.]
MWLLPVFSSVARNALRVFYRFSSAGGRVPREGPVLLVANHPNSLLDPGMVVAVARRPVRFMAKAPLFTDPLVGWLVRGAGAVPVYRKQDDPAAMGQNDDTFLAVWDALAGGDAVGIFPEGISHDAPALAPLKTGAARIALGAALRTGGAFPVVPVGLSFRHKGTFRSEALAVVGEPVAWDDLAHAGPEDREAVPELTRRIEAALRAVTLNLERWEDAPLVEMAEAVYAAELPVSPNPADRVARLRQATEGLARLRAEERAEWNAVAREVAAHGRLLKVLGLRPRELKAAPRTLGAAVWTARNLLFFALAAPVASLGVALYWVPYRLTGVLEAKGKHSPDVRATFKLLVGGALSIAWTLVLIGAAAALGGWIGALSAAVALPLIGVTTLHVVEHWRRAVADARYFLLRTRRRETLDALRQRQRALAERLHALWKEVRV